VRVFGTAFSVVPRSGDHRGLKNLDIKNRLRKARHEGHFVGLIDSLAKLRYEAKNLRSYLHKGEVIAALRERRYGADPGNWVEFALQAGSGFLQPMQSKHEITRLIERVLEMQPKAVLEIGTARGGTLFLFCRSAAPDAEIVSLDLPYGRNGGGFPKWKAPIYQLFAEPDQKLILIRANSHMAESRELVEGAVSGRKFDVIMIDADHSYEGAKRDFELYSSLVSDRGIVVLHDILPNRFDPEINVHKLWEEISPNNQCEEIVADYRQGNLGIGVITGLGERS
jgi:predicted O-methyltransferase YrrM